MFLVFPTCTQFSFCSVFISFFVFTLSHNTTKTNTVPGWGDRNSCLQPLEKGNVVKSLLGEAILQCNPCPSVGQLQLLGFRGHLQNTDIFVRLPFLLLLSSFFLHINRILQSDLSLTNYTSAYLGVFKLC